MRRNAGGFKDLRETQLTASQETETSVLQPQEQNSANNLNEFGSRLFPRASR